MWTFVHEIVDYVGIKFPRGIITGGIFLDLRVAHTPHNIREEPYTDKTRRQSNTQHKRIDLP